MRQAVWTRGSRLPACSRCVCSTRATLKATAVTPGIKEELDQKGYACIPQFASLEECAELKNRSQELLADFDPATVSIFSTKNQEALTDNYFLDSANNVSFFFEENAFDESGNLRQAKDKSVNKMGHALHDMDPVFRRFSRSPKMQALFRDLGFQRPLPVQSMYIFKQPKFGGEVVPHQDSAFLRTQPLSTVGIWLAIEDATVENGCLFVMDDSHHKGVVSPFVKAPNGEVGFPEGKPSWDVSLMKPLPVKAGTLVLLHGSNVHGSNENTSSKSRHAYSMHVAEGAPVAEWVRENWLQRHEDCPFEDLYD